MKLNFSKTYVQHLVVAGLRFFQLRRCWFVVRVAVQRHRQLVLVERPERPTALAVELQQQLVILGERRHSVSDGQQGDALLLRGLVDYSLGLEADRARALVQERVLRRVVEESGHREPLFLAAGQSGVPVADGVETLRLSLHEATQVHVVEQLQQLLVRAVLRTATRRNT